MVGPGRVLYKVLIHASWFLITYKAISKVPHHGANISEILLPYFNLECTNVG